MKAKIVRVFEYPAPYSKENEYCVVYESGTIRYNRQHNIPRSVQAFIDNAKKVTPIKSIVFNRDELIYE